MRKIAVITDSGSGFTPQEANAFGIHLIALQVSIDDKTYRDSIELSTQEVYEALKAGKFPKTASPLGLDIQTLFEKLQTEGYDVVIAVPISSGLSGTQQALHMHASAYEFEFHQIEVFSTSMIQKHMAITAKQWVDEGRDVSDILNGVSELAQRSNTLILPSDLNHLKNGGRLTPLAASLAAMLKIRPVLQLNASTQGKIDVLAKIRTDRKALDYTIDVLLQSFDQHQTLIHIIHSADDERAQLAKSILMEKGYPEAYITTSDIAAVIASHTGLACLGLQFIPR